MRHPVFTLALAAVGLLIVCTAASSAFVYVKRDSPGPTFDGTSWDTAYHTVQAGLNAATSGDEVWVARGTYVERITLKDGIALFGGFIGTETARSQRDWRAYATVLDGSQAGAVVTSPAGVTDATRIDGFTIRNGNAHVGGGLYCAVDSWPIIANNLITANTAWMGGGIHCQYALILNNTITGNTATAQGGGIACMGSRNSGSVTIANNVIAGNTAREGGGVWCWSHPAAILNNTIIWNTADSGGGMSCRVEEDPPPYGIEIANSVVAFNSSGILALWRVPVVRNNCVYGNGSYNYSGLSPGIGDICENPLFEDAAHGDYHLRSGSPCIESGGDYSSVEPAGWPDMDGERRIQGAHVDMGADEFPAEGGTGIFSLLLEVPSIFRSVRENTLVIRYGNKGGGDLPAHVLTVSAPPGVSMRLEQSDQFTESPIQVLGIAFDGRAGLIESGKQYRIPVYFKASDSLPGHSRINFTVTELSESAAIDWAMFENQVRPPDADPAVWNPIVERLRQRIGTKWAGYADCLRENATRLGDRGQRVYDVRELFAFELDKAIDEASGAILGRVYLADTGAPVADAEVIVSAVGSEAAGFAQTDAQGAFVAQFLPPGTHQITMKDYVLDHPVQAMVIEGQDALGVDVSVRPGGKIVGTVRDQSGVPISGALVSAADGEDAAGVASSESDGAYEISGLPGGTYSLTCSRDSFVSGTLNGIIVDLGAVASGVDFVLKPGGTLTGRVTSAADGSVLSDVAVTLDGTDEPAAGTVTAEDGTYRISGIPLGQYSACFVKDGYNDEEREIAIGGGAVVLDVAMHLLGRITGTVTNSYDSTPLPDVAVQASLANGEIYSGVTDEDGHYEIAGLASGEYLVAVGDGVAAVNPTEIQIPETTTSVSVDFELNAIGSIQGTILAPDSSTPVSDASVRLLLDDEEVAWAETGTSGEYRFLILQPGTYEVRAQAESFVFLPSGELVVETGTGITGNDLIAGSSLLAGTVHDAASGTAVRSADISISLLCGDGPTQSVAILCTDESGSFTLTNAHPGTYRLVVTATGYARGQQEVQVEPGQMQVSTMLELGPASTISGVIFDESASPVGGAIVVAYLGSEIDPFMSCLSDESGAYMLAGLPEGDYEIRAVRQDSGCASASVPLEESGDAIQDLSFSAATGHIQGTVTDSQSRPLPGASASLLDQSGRLVGIVLVDPSGHYDFGGLSSGTYTVEVACANHASGQSADLALAEAQTLTDVDFVLSAVACAQVDEEAPGQTASAHSPAELPSADRTIVGDVVGPIPLPPDSRCCPSDWVANGLYDLTWNCYADVRDAQDNLKAAQAAVAAKLTACMLRVTREISIAIASRTIAGAIARIAFIPGSPAYLLWSGVFDGIVSGGYQLNMAIARQDWNFGARAVDDTLTKIEQACVLAGSLKLLPPNLSSIVLPLSNVLLKMLGTMRTILLQIDSDFAELARLNTALDDADRAFQKAAGDYFDQRKKYFDYCRRCTAGVGEDGTTGSGTPGPGPGTPVGAGGGEVVTSNDPNEKAGPPGEGEQRLVSPLDELEYTVFFENAPTASAPVQEAVITDDLSSALDWSTLKLAEIAFGDKVIPIDDLPSYSGSMDVPNIGPNPPTLRLEISAAVNSQTGRARWMLRCVDPATGELPTDPLAGFLPANNSQTGCGEGRVRFKIRPKSDVAAGTAISNSASIVFDGLTPVATNAVTNTIALLPPGSVGVPSPADGEVGIPVNTALSWSAADRATTYDLYLWRDGQSRPPAPTAADWPATGYQPLAALATGTTYHWQVVAKNSAGEMPGPEWTLGTAALPPIGMAVTSPDSELASVKRAVVSAAFIDFFYIEADDRSRGIRVEMPAHRLLLGMRADVTGLVKTNSDGERYVAATWATQNGTGHVAPLALIGRALGGAGWNYDAQTGAGQMGVMYGVDLNNIGLLIRTRGKVTQLGEGYLYIDDGSGLKDGTSTGTEENVGVRVICDPAGYSSGEKVEVTGISSCFWTPSGIARRILTRRPEDVRKLTGP